MRTFLFSATVGLIVFGMAAAEAQAQRGGRGGVGIGRGWGGGGWGGWGYGGFGRGLGYGGYGYNNSYWGGYGNRGYGYGYGNYGYGNPLFSFYRFPGYSTTYRSYPYYNNTYYTYAYPNYYQPDMDYSNAPRQLANNESIVLVRVPDPDAKVLIDGQATSQTGTERVFYPPKLEPGYTYSYTITASFNRDGSQVQEQRTVQIVPGQPAFVDFTTEQVNSPK